MTFAQRQLQLCGAALAVFIGFVVIGGAALALGASDQVLDFLGNAFLVTEFIVFAFVLWRTRRS